MEYLFIFIVGAAIGSFMGALTWRMPREISIAKGRSKCPKCKHTIAWHDNIPVVSWFVLRGRCRNCKKTISKREVLIETGLAALFVAAFHFYPQLVEALPWLQQLPWYLGLLLVFAIVCLSVGIFVVDLEHQYIPDYFVFVLVLLPVISFLAYGYDNTFVNIASGLGAAAFLLSIHLLTRGAGMGLGDVKLAVSYGVILGFPNTVVWMSATFFMGALIGIILILFKLAAFKNKIAFGPFLVASFFMTCIYGNKILDLFFNYVSG